MNCYKVCFHFHFICLPYLKGFFKKWKEVWLVSLPLFLYYVWRKIFLALHANNWPNFIAWLSLLLEIFGNMCIVIIFCVACDIINFEINLSFFIKRFHNMSLNRWSIGKQPAVATFRNKVNTELSLIRRIKITKLNPLSTNTTKWINTIK